MSYKKIIDRMFNKVFCKIKPISYAKKLGVKIGNGTRIYAPDIGMWSTEPWLITIGDNCHITYGVRFITHDDGTLVIRPEEYNADPFVICGDITVGSNVYIGERVTILPGVTIGDNVIIGCGAVVCKDIPSNVVAAGVPCEIVNSRDAYIEKIKKIMRGEDERYYSNLEYMHSKNPNRRR